MLLHLVVVSLGSLGGACGEPPPPLAVPVSVPQRVEPEPRAAPPPPRRDGRLPAGVRPLRATLSMRLDSEREQLRGRVRYLLSVEAPAHHLVLHARGITMHGAEVRDVSGPTAATHALRAGHGAPAVEPEELVLALDRPLPAGEAELVLDFEAPLKSGLQGVYRVERGGARYVFTQFEPTDARRAFPCFDEPSFKHPWTVSLEVPEGDLAFANAPEIRRERTTPGWWRFDFAETPPLPSYLVAFASGPLESLEGPREPVPLRVIARRGMASLGRLALEVAAGQLATLGEWFGRDYPYPKLDLVAVPEFAAGAMENPGLVTFREELLLVEPTGTTAARRRVLPEVMAHELAHQWFGNLVTLAWWDDLWLNEAFATWMQGQVLIRDPVLGPEVRSASALAKHRVLGLDGLTSTRRVREPVRTTAEAREAFDGVTYAKGAALLDMVERWLGPEPFRSGLRTYLARHAWGNATAADLFQALGEASSGRDLAGVLSSFTERTGAPALAARVECTGTPALALSQRRFRPRGASPLATDGDPPWKFPVEIRLPGTGRAETLLVEREARIALPSCPVWVWPNLGERGYYRVELTDADLPAMAGALRELSGAERVGLLENAWASVQMGTLSGAGLLGLLAHFAGDVDPSVTASLVSTVRRLAPLVPDASRPAFSRRVASLLGPELRKLGLEPRAGEPERVTLRRSALALLLAEHAPSVVSPLVPRALAWLERPETVHPDTARVALVVAAARADAAFFDAVRARLGASGPPEHRLLALVALGALESPTQRERAFALVQNGEVRPHELRYLAASLLERPEARRHYLEFQERQWESLAAVLPAPVLSRLGGALASLCDLPELERYRAFYAARLAGVEGAERVLRQAEEAARICATLRAAEAPGLARALGAP